jgi:acetolactate decarboxylase
VTTSGAHDFPAYAVRRWLDATLAHGRRDEVHQTSSMGALLAGVYDGNVTIRELLRHGDFGLGTFNALDGEMLVLDGVCYQLRADGSATIADPDEVAPFATLTWFNADHTIAVSAPIDAAALKAEIDKSVASSNLIAVIRIRGQFSEVHTRTVTAQHKPYRPFTDATEDQHEVRFTNVSGTLAGFRTPEYEQGISVAGYHPHFIDAERPTTRSSSAPRSAHSLTATVPPSSTTALVNQPLRPAWPAWQFGARWRCSVRLAAHGKRPCREVRSELPPRQRFDRRCSQR